MRRRGPLGALLGFVMVVIGVFILFAMVLPAGFWWFLFGMALIAAGFCCLRRH